MSNQKLWGGRFNKPTHKLVDEFNASIEFDQKLYEQDIQGSIAHATMLGQCGIIPKAEAQTICSGLENIAHKISTHDVKFNLSDEDIHMNIERLLHEEIGEVAGKLHTARSRNDQVATDLHLYLRGHVANIIKLLTDLQQSLLNQAKQHVETLIPGYTHLQRAQPISFSHHLLCYFNMFQRDKVRLQDSLPRINTMPLGAGALAGTSFEIDRKFTAKTLGFDSVYSNSLDAVSDRDFVIEFLSHASLIMMHLSRLSEELILWSSQEFQFIELDDAFCTGSSMMPNKKNPDVAELARGKTGRVYGALIGILTVMKGLPLTYNKDLQEDKEGLFDTVKTLNHCLSLFAPMIDSMSVKKDRMAQAVNQDFSNATEIADYLCRKGIPFRQAHAVSGQLVMYCIKQDKYLMDLAIETYQQFHDAFEPDLYDCIQPYNIVSRKNSEGGTGFESVQHQLHLANDLLK